MTNYTTELMSVKCLHCSLGYDHHYGPKLSCVKIPTGEATELQDPLAVQVGGDHYKKMKIQPMEFSMANKLDACQHTIIKYVSRFRDKNGIDDLLKARHTLDMLIAFEKGASNA